MSRIADERRSPEGAAERDELATIRVVLLGRFGLESVDPALRGGEAAVLGVGAATAVSTVEGGQVTAAQRLTLSLAVASESISEGQAAAWLAAVRGRLEDPMSMVV